MSPAATSTMLLAALEYAEHGDLVFPVWPAAGAGCACGKAACDRPGKHPLGLCAPHGLRGASRDPGILARWWTAYPRANIGLRTGVTYTVLDVDPGTGGDASLARLEAVHGPLPQTPRIHTGGGGRHFYFEVVPGLRNSMGLIAGGLDIRGEDGYTIVPPSNHASGGVYADDPDSPLYETPPARMPSWLIALAQQPSTATGDGQRSSEDWAVRLAGAPVGQRHAVAAQIVGHFLGLGITPDEVELILLGFCARCAPPFAEEEARRVVRDLAAKDARKAAPAAAGFDDWPPPQPAPSGLLPVPAFEIDRLVPVALAPWVADVSARAQCPPDFVAIGVIVAAASVVGRQVTIRPKLHDDWTVVPNLWGLAVAGPGLMKTSAMQEALRGVRHLVSDAREGYQRACEHYTFDEAAAKAQRAALDKQLKAAAQRGESVERLREAFEALPQPSPPTERRYVVNDATVEKLGVLLNENPNGLLHFRDEAGGWFQTMEREGHENDRAFFCEAWNGTGSYTYDRIGRGTLHIEAACVSLLGGIQPRPLAAYLRETFSRGQDDGLIQRFQLLVYPDVAPTWRNVDHWPDTDARQRLVATFQALDRLDLLALGVHTEPRALPFVRFTSEGQERFDAWRAGLEVSLRTSRDHPVMLAHLAKYRSLAPSLALVFHLVDCATSGQGGPVSDPQPEAP